MLDNAFGIFNNVVPRFQWAEIDLTFPSDDRYFKIRSYDELVKTNQFPSRKMKIKDAFLVLFSPPEANDKNLAPLREGNLTALDMQMLIHCWLHPSCLLSRISNTTTVLYTQIWGSLFTNPLLGLPGTSIPTLVQPHKVALRNWKVMWEWIRTSSPELEWNNLGFCRTAETYYDAVMAIIDVFERKGPRLGCIPSDCEKGSHLKRLLGEEWTGGLGMM
jgi:hypothetical protein